MKTKLIAGLVVLALVATAVGVISARNNFGVQLPHQWARGSCWMNQSKYNITCPSGPKFVDEDGNGINDTMSPHGWRYWRGPG